MKKIVIIAAAAFLFAACAQKSETKVAEEPKTYTKEEMKNMTFDQLFRPIDPSAIPGNVFDLVGKDFTVITAGTPGDHNSMVAGWGGWGVQFNKPVTWCFLRSNRYTLELMRREKVYTMCYFDEQYRDDIMLFGSRSGRDSDKMKQSALSPVRTPGGSTAWKEAKLVIECRLVEVTSVSPEDFYTEEGRDFVTAAHEETGDWHKMVFGEIMRAWVSD